MEWSDSLLVKLIAERGLALALFGVLIIGYSLFNFHIGLTAGIVAVAVVGLLMHGSDNQGLTTNLMQFVVLVVYICVVMFSFLDYKHINEFVRVDNNMTYSYGKTDGHYNITIIKNNKRIYSFSTTNEEFIKHDLLDVNISKSNSKFFHTPSRDYKIMSK